MTTSTSASSDMTGLVLRSPPATRVRTTLRDISFATEARSAVTGERKRLAVPSLNDEARYSAKMPPGPKETTGPKSRAKR